MITVTDDKNIAQDFNTASFGSSGRNLVALDKVYILQATARRSWSASESSLFQAQALPQGQT
jgi:hypothetical protein